MAKAVHLARLRRQDRETRTQKLLVYEMGKAGSLGIVRALEEARPRAAVHHVAVLSRDGVRRLEGLARDHPERRPPEHLWTSLHLRRQIDRGLHRRSWRVITLVRDPIARNVSSFFQVLEPELGYDYESRSAELWPDQLVQELLSLFWLRWPFHDRPLTYFDDELKSVFGVDVYATPFPKEQGYGILRAGEVDVLVLKHERLAECTEAAFHEFLGLDGIRAESAGEDACDPYAENYGRFLGELRIPTEYADRMYGSRYAGHFYTAAELESFRRRWMAPIPIPPTEVR